LNIAEINDNVIIGDEILNNNSDFRGNPDDLNQKNSKLKNIPLKNNDLDENQN